MKNRAYRFENKKIKIRKAFRILKFAWDFKSYYNDEEILKYAKKWADNLKLCSCPMCCNPRHSFLHNNEITVQEKKNKEDDMIFELL